MREIKMGINTDTFGFTQQSIISAGFELNKIKMCELGNQHMNVKGIDYQIAKEYYQSLGVDQTSLDINGLDGAIAIDLTKSVKLQNFSDTFDIITNHGTSEHVYDQYCCFKNIHDLCCKGGLFIHILPLAGHWKLHCDYHYKEDFFSKLASLCNYQIIDQRIFTNIPNKKFDSIGVSMIKKDDSDFIDRFTFYQLPIIMPIIKTRYFIDIALGIERGFFRSLNIDPPL
jgi:SAM-dependent methyltransferase